MRIAVVGTRTPKDENVVERHLARFFKKSDIVVSGGAKGIDSQAEELAEKLGLKTRIFKPVYETYGRYAPLERNTEIVANCDLMVAFPCQESSVGTWDSICKAKAYGKRVIVIDTRGA